jgi:ribonuclease Z
MRRVIGFVLAVVLAALAGGWLLVRTSTRAQDAVMARMIARRALGDRTELLADDALHVVLCGTGSPLPDPRRASACTAIVAGGAVLLIDAGPGAGERLNALRLPSGRLAAVLLTHFHSDHIGGLGEVALASWVGGRTAPLRVLGGPGVERVARGFETAYAADAGYRTAHHGTDLLPPAAAHLEPVVIDVPRDGGPVIAFDEDGLVVRAFRVQHAPVEPAYGYRVEWRGRAVVLSGDTARTDAVVRAATGADVLVHEALAPHMVEAIAAALAAHGDTRRARILRDIPGYHTTPVEAAEVANAAGVRLLVLTHVVPPLPNAVAERIFLRGVDAVRGHDTLLGHDGLELRLPADSVAIERPVGIDGGRIFGD